MKKLNVKIIDSKTLELLEKGDIGDLIDLTIVNRVDTKIIEDQIKAKKDLIYQELLTKELNQAKLSAELEFKQRENDLNLKIQDLSQALKDQEDKLRLTLTNEHLKEVSNLNLKISNLTNEKNNLTLNYQNTISQLKTENEAKIIKETQNLINQINDLKLSNQEKTHDLNQKIDNLQREKSAQIKIIGEDLENWADRRFRENNLVQPDNIKWYKDNETRGGTKGDFIYEVYGTKEEVKDTLLTSAMLEMKSEDPTSSSKQNLNTILRKLDSDRNKKNLEYAILVSEIDYDNNDIQVERVQEYDKMFIVRPQYFMTLLNVITAFALKYEEILVSEAREEIKFKDINDILLEFESMKTSIIDNQLKHIHTHLETITKQNESIINASKKISESLEIIVDSHLKTLENKIKDFNIKRITRKIEQL